MLRKLTAVLLLVFISAACATRDNEVTDLGALAKAFGEAARDKGVQDAESDNPEVRSSATTGLATIVADAVALTTPGKLPGKAKLTAKESNFRTPAGRSAAEGWVAIVAAATLDELGVLRQARIKSFNKLQVTVAGTKSQANYDPTVFGALVCGSTNAAPKNMTASFKLKGTQNLPAGAGAIYLFARIPLALFGLSPAQWEQTCNSATNLLPTLRAIGAVETGFELAQ